jgi:S-DNA-T family DNA segregation ATPase FtsK/SpoIIIE
MAQINLTANLARKDTMDKMIVEMRESLEIKFNKLHIWRLALFLSLKSEISEDELKKVYVNEKVTEGIKMSLDTFIDNDLKFIFINLLSIVHNRKIDINSEFPELLKLHCRHGFDILENELDEIGINDNIIDIFIKQLEKPKNIDINSIEDSTNTDNLINKFKEAFTELKYPLKFKEQKIFDRVIKLYFDIQDISYATNTKLYGHNLILQLETFTALRDKVYIQQTKIERVVSINIKKDSKPIFIHEYKNEINSNDLSLIVGMDDEDNLQKADLKDLAHLLVAGTTGSGKTVFLHSLIYQLLHKNIELYLIDGKNGYEFGKYKDKVNMISDTEEIIPIIKKVIKEMEDRYEYDYIDKSKTIVVIVDEFVDLIMQNRLIEDLFVRLAQKGRAVNIHLILATQRPDSNIMKGVLRSNIPSRVAFKVQKSTESKIILDESGAENLFVKGDMLFSDGKKIIRLQGFLINE